MQKQPSSKMCFVCGRENPIGFRLQFFEDGDGCVYADYTPHEEHQGFPGVMHGGLVTPHCSTKPWGALRLQTICGA